MVDEEIVVDKLRHINEYINNLKEMRGMTKEDYITDTVLQRALEQTFMNFIQSCIDLAQHIRAAEGFRPRTLRRRKSNLWERYHHN